MPGTPDLDRLPGVVPEGAVPGARLSRSSAGVVDALTRPFEINLIRAGGGGRGGSVLDLALTGGRTLVHRIGNGQAGRLFLYARNGVVDVEDLDVQGS